MEPERATRNHAAHAVHSRYVGNHGVKLPMSYYVNQPQLPNASQLSAIEAAPAYDYYYAQQRAPFTNVGITYLYDSNRGVSSYNAMNLRFEGRSANA